MRATLPLSVISLLFFTGCTVYETHPRPVVHEEVVRDEPTVVYREEGPPPPARVEVVPERPYRGARWQPGHWYRDREHHRWVWVGGHYI